MELTTIGRSVQSSFQHHASTLDNGGDSMIEQDDELELQWAAIERLPTFKRLRTSVFDIDHDNGSGKDFKGKRVTDVTKLGAVERHLFIEKLIKHIENDNLLLLQKLRDRIDRYLNFSVHSARPGSRYAEFTFCVFISILTFNFSLSQHTIFCDLYVIRSV